MPARARYGRRMPGGLVFAIAVPKNWTRRLVRASLCGIIQKVRVSPSLFPIARNAVGAKATRRAVSQHTREAAILSGMKPFPRLLFVYLLAALPAVVLAEPPAASYIFPAGGQRGTKVAVRVGGMF